MPRREFTKAVKAEIVKRAMRDGVIHCEGCGLSLGAKRFDIDHRTPDALEIDKSTKLTADDGQLLGWECCHKGKTAKDVAVIAKAKRREAKHLGIAAPGKPIESRGFQKTAKSQNRVPKPEFNLPRRQLYREV